uniref:Endonuclease/exonuclease/phosphatase domain-containing protein n=1 Tax=Arion vulgaris TaxID=1028688 RepID=A0A0B7AGS2_9EUPU
MPRVTRRSVTSKDESSPVENPKTTSSRKRGAKKEDPEAEDVAEGEPQETPPKRGGRQAAKESKPEVSTKSKTAARGRSTSRGGRGKKEQEQESEEEEASDSEHEEEEERVPKGSAKGRGRGKSGRGGRSSTRGARNTSRTGRGSKAAEEEEVEEDIDKEESDEDDEIVVKGRGGRARGKAPAAATPQSGKRGKGRASAAAVEDNEEKMEEDKGEEEEPKHAENAEATPKGRQRQTPNKEEKPATPSTGERRGRGQKTETTPKTPPAPGRSSKRGSTAASSAEIEKPVSEPMDTEEVAASSKTEDKKDELSTAEIAPKSAEKGSGTKRKVELDVDEQAAKRQKTDLKETDIDEELKDFVVINKNDAPDPDSKEIADSLPPAVSEKVSQPSTPDDAECEGFRTRPLVVNPDAPCVVPLTEAELAKQYTSQHSSDKDETSSILVEVGSECASDITGLSSRGLDVSDMVSLDSMDQTSEAASDLVKDPASPPGLQADSAVPQQINNVPAVDPPVLLQNAPSNAGLEVSQTAVGDSQLPSLPDKVVEPNESKSSHSSETKEVHGGSAPLENASNNIVRLPSQAPSQNGTAEETADPLLTSKPEKTTTEAYVPSSTTIDSRKFVLNPAFPVEMMDPAFCFSVVSYNILADCHLRRGDYSYTQPQFLDQEYRNTLLLKELDYLDGDIICLQEVCPAYYTKTLLPAMKSRGYDGSFIKRTKEYWDEGEATFVKTSKFEIISQQSSSLGELAFKELDDSGLSPEVSQAAKKYLDRADVILLTELNCKKTEKVITVCNIHVVYDLKAPDVQCIQVACAIKQLVEKAVSDLNPHIICGDFNSDVTSPGYQLAKDGYLSDDHIQKLQALQNLDNTDGSSRSLINYIWRAFQHTSSNLKSTYELTLGKEPPITSFTKTTHKTLDYIFHSAASIDTVGVLETLDLQVVDATGGLPSASIPSDHLSLKAVFRLKD